jgi:hypothetical protein
MKNHIGITQKRLWIIVGVLFVIIICGLFTWLGGGMAEMMRSHMGL